MSVWDWLDMSDAVFLCKRELDAVVVSIGGTT